MWGTGSPKREFMHSDDVAAASLFLMENYDGDEIVNIGWGKDISVLNFTNMVKDVVGYEGEIVLDPTKPDGTPRKVMDVSRLKSLGFEPKVSLREGVERTVADFMKEHR